MLQDGACCVLEKGIQVHAEAIWSWSCGGHEGAIRRCCEAASANLQVRNIYVSVYGVHSVPDAVPCTAFALPVEPEVHIT